MDVELKQIEALLDQEQIESAASRLDRRVSRTPNCADCWYLLSRVAAKSDRLSDAVELNDVALWIDAAHLPSLRQSLRLSLNRRSWQDINRTVHRLRDFNEVPEDIALEYLQVELESWTSTELIELTERVNWKGNDLHAAVANRFQDKGLDEQALQHYAMVIGDLASQADAVIYFRAGISASRLGRSEKAVALFRAAAVCANTDSILAGQIWNALGLALQRQGRHIDAELAFVRGLRFDPGQPQAANNLGLQYGKQGCSKLGLAMLQVAATNAPQQPEVHCNLAHRYHELGRWRDARHHYQRAAEIADDEPLLQLKGVGVFPNVVDSTEQQSKLINEWSKTTERVRSSSRKRSLDELLILGQRPPFELQFADGNLRRHKEAIGQLYHGMVSQPSLGNRKSTPQLGIVITKHHEGLFLRSVGKLFSALPKQWELHFLIDSSGRQRMQESISHPQARLHNLAKDASALEQVLSLHLDMLYYWEIGTDPLNYFLPLYRLAPIQCTSWGIQVTSGIPNVDFYLSNKTIEPDDAAEHYSERLVLSERLLSFQPRMSEQVTVLPRSEWELCEDDHVYMCAQQAAKIHPSFDAYLQGILTGDPNAVVVLLASGHARQRLTERLSRKIVDHQRIRFLDRMPRERYLSALLMADVLLDPPVFGGVNSTYDGLALAKPVVTRPSNFHRGRYTLGCYRQMGVNDCVTETMEDYIATAVRLANDPIYRDAVSQRIRSKQSLIFEDPLAIDAFIKMMTDCMKMA